MNRKPIFAAMIALASLTTSFPLGSPASGAPAEAGPVAPTAKTSPTLTCFGRVATILGTSAADEITGTPKRDVIVGLGGEDRIFSREGNDLVCGGNSGDFIKTGAGDDKVKGQSGDDFVNAGSGDDRVWTGRGLFEGLFGGPGADRLFGGPGRRDSLVGGAGDDYMDGGPGLDTAEFFDSTSGIQADLATDSATGEGNDVIVDIEGLIGSNFDDVLLGDEGTNLLVGQEGDDLLRALGSGDEGPEMLVSGGGTDVVEGGDGPDIISYEDSPTAVTVDLAQGTATGWGSTTFSGIEHVIGSDVNDTLLGDANDNILVGRFGDDTLIGADGTDEADGGPGFDTCDAETVLGCETESGGQTLADETDLKTVRISLAADGSQLGRSSELPIISGDGRFVAFASRGAQLVAGDTNGFIDTFVWDRETGLAERVSVSSTGEEADGTSLPTSISPDGRYVVFNSDAPNLVENDGVPTNLEGALDVFVHDRETGETERISISTQGDPAFGAPSFGGQITPDGRFVAFVSAAQNLDALDTDATYDIFVRDLEAGSTEMVSLKPNGEETPFMAMAPSISADGRFVAFDANDELVPEDTNHAADSYVRDRQLGTTTMVSVRSDGSVARKGGVSPEISPDGRVVLFYAESSFASADRNGDGDAYMHDLQTGETTLVSRTWKERVGNSHSFPLDMSADGRYVLFGSFATNMVEGDTNGKHDFFLADLVENTTIRVNLNNRGRQAVGEKQFHLLATMSDDGSWVAFESSARNLVRDDTNGVYDIFLRGPYPVAQ